MSANSPEVGERWRRKMDGKRLTITQLRGSRFGEGSLRFVFDAHPAFEPEYTRADFLELYEIHPGQGQGKG